MRDAARARRILARYASAGLRDRGHVATRLRSVPFAAILDALPERGLLASFGCGHAAIEIGAALEGPGRTIVAADIDARKLAVARAAAKGLPLELVEGDVLDLLAARRAKPAALLVVDVLYLVDDAGQRDFFRRARATLGEGGQLFVKEMDERPRWKATWNRFQEFLACRVLRLTRHRGGVVGLRSREAWCALLAEAGFTDICATPLDRGYLHPHLLLTARA